MSEKKCADCKYFIQHYCLNQRKLFRVYCGHCTFSGVKRKHPDGKACGNFVPGPVDVDAFVDQEYLSKELLQRVLSLPLLPKIEEYPAPIKRKRRRMEADGGGHHV